MDKNKILITGASSGIGRELTEQFCRLDNEIIAVGRNKFVLDDLEKLDKRITAFQCDISSPLELGKLVKFIRKEHPNLNVLINNAGIQYNELLLSETYAYHNIEDEININLTSPIKLIKALGSLLQANGNAAIVNVSSGLAFVPKVNSAVYCGTKAAIHVFSKSLRYQLDEVKVFELIPPLVDTKMTKGRHGNKISAKRVVDEFLKAFEYNRYEVNIHKVKFLRVMNRISPNLADRIIKSGTN